MIPDVDGSIRGGTVAVNEYRERDKWTFIDEIKYDGCITRIWLKKGISK